MVFRLEIRDLDFSPFYFLPSFLLATSDIIQDMSMFFHESGYVLMHSVHTIRFSRYKYDFHVIV